MDVVNYFGEGRKHYAKGNWDRAIKSFKEALAGHPKDRLSNIYIERCKKLKAKPPKNWAGVWTMDSK